MSTYQVVKSEKKKDVTGGAIVQLLTLKNAEGKEKDGVTMFIPAGQPAPVVGAALEGTVEYDEKFQEFKFKPDRKGPYTGRSGASKDFKADPAKLEVERAKNRSIAGQASQKVAVDVIRLAIETQRDPAELARLTVEMARILLPQIQELMEEAK